MQQKRFIIQPTTQAIWYHVVKDAHRESGYQYNEDVENYLVITLEKFLTENEFASETVALRLLDNINLENITQGERLREVGDECLLLSGLFPERALKRNVSLNYYIGAGRQAYKTLSHQSAESFHNPVLFDLLSKHFVGLMDILHLIRKKPAVNS